MIWTRLSKERRCYENLRNVVVFKNVLFVVKNKPWIKNYKVFFFRESSKIVLIMARVLFRHQFKISHYHYNTTTLLLIRNTCTVTDTACLYAQSCLKQNALNTVDTFEIQYNPAITKSMLHIEKMFEISGFLCSLDTFYKGKGSGRKNVLF